MAGEFADVDAPPPSPETDSPKVATYTHSGKGAVTLPAENNFRYVPAGSTMARACSGCQAVLTSDEELDLHKRLCDIASQENALPQPAGSTGHGEGDPAETQPANGHDGKPVPNTASAPASSESDPTASGSASTAEVELLTLKVASLEKMMVGLDARVEKLDAYFQRAVEMLALKEAEAHTKGVSTGVSGKQEADEAANNPYEDYIGHCHRLSRPHVPEAMLAFGCRSQSLRVSTINDADMLPMCLALKTNAFVTSVELLGGFGQAGAIHLAEALKHNTNVVDVDITNCEVKPLGATALSHWLDKSLTARALSLEGCDVRCKGTQALADALKRNKYLTILNLKRNSIGDAGAKALADALAHNKRLTSLDLSRNNISEEGLTALTMGVRRNRSINTLNVGNNPDIDPRSPALKTLHDLLLRNISAVEKQQLI
eukprot:jgi/Mesvir1/26274/Mv01637-RA.1